MPAVLVEVGFMIHPEEFAQLLDPAVQGRVAEGLLKGVRKYLARQ
jgi:N-acetylmuramoyl-L-alanine amidase